VNRRKRPAKSELTSEELEAQKGEPLPDREAMSLVNLDVSIPVDPAIAANVLADETVADADVEQETESDQET